MKRLFIFLLAFTLIGVLGIGKAYADEIVYQSDTDTKYYNGVNYVNSIAAWKHPSWPLIPSSSAIWIWNSEYVTEPREGEIVEFQKQFDILGIPISGEITAITADNEYVVSINETQVGSGASWSLLQTHPFGANLIQGTNTLKVIVKNWAWNTDSSTVNPGGLIYKFTFDDKPTIPANLHFEIGGEDVGCGFTTEAPSVTVDWDQSFDSSSITGYQYQIVYPLPSPQTGFGTWTPTFTSTQYTGTLNIGTHTVRIRASDSMGHWSDWTEPCTITRIANDNDGVDYTNDFCLGTPTSDEPSLTETLGVNRHIWSNKYDPSFETLVPGQKGAKVPAESQFSISETRGCSCIQILDLLKANGLGEFGGHYKFGCSKSIMQDFILDINDGIIDGRYYINSYNVSARYGDIGTTTEFYTSEGITYDLEVSGTFRFANWGTDYGIADAEYMSRKAPYNISGFVDGWAQNPDPDNPPCGADLKINNTCQNWGVYNPEHKYMLTHSGDGEKIKFSIFDDYYSDNSGFLTVKVYANL